MNMSWLFFKKECLTFWRSRRALIMVVVFAVLGILSPLMAKLTPEILKLSSETAALSALMPKADSAASWTQYYKNMSQIGLLVFAIVFGTSVSSELKDGTLINLVTKGLPRRAVILGKVALAILTWIGSVTLAFLISWAYTAYYFPDHKSPHLLAGLVALLVFGLLLSAVLIFGSSLGQNSAAGLLTGVVAYAGLAILNLFKSCQRFNPLSLLTDNMTLTTGGETLSHYAPAIVITLVATGLLTWAAVRVLEEKRL